MDDDDIVEVRGAPAPRREDRPQPNEPLLDTGTKIALIAFVIAFGIAVVAVVGSVAFF